MCLVPEGDFLQLRAEEDPGKKRITLTLKKLEQTIVVIHVQLFYKDTNEKDALLWI